MYGSRRCVCVCVDEREKLVLYLLVGLLVGGISVLFIVNVYMMVILVRHRRQLRGLGVQPVSASRLRHRRRRRLPAETATFVGNGPPPSASPELSRRAGAERPRPAPRRPPSPYEALEPAATPTTPPPSPRGEAAVHLPPRDSPVFVHVESPRESPLLGRVPPLPPSVDVSPPPSESPVWVRFQDTSDGTATAPAEGSSPVWVQVAPLDDSPSTTMSTSTPAAAPPAAAAPVASGQVPSYVSPASSTLGGRRAAAVVYPAAAAGPSARPVDTLTLSYSNPYRQDSSRTTAERRRSTTPQRPRHRRLLRFD